MKALLLAAGLGTRLKPLTDTVPKCLVPIRSRPLLGIWLDNLRDAGIGPVLVNTHYLAEEVSRFVQQSPHRADVTLVHEPVLLGTAGTLVANRLFFGRRPVLLAHADNLCLADFTSFVDAHMRRPSGAAMTMMTFLTDTPESCGVVELDDKGLVVGFHEKVSDPPGHLANGAVYIVEPEVVDYLESLRTQIIDFSTEVIPRFMGRIFTWHNSGVHRDIGTVSSWQAAQALAQVPGAIGDFDQRV